MTLSELPEPSGGHGHVERISVHYDDLDSMGIVHNARYGLMLERALSSFWTGHGYSFENGVFSQPDVCVAVAEFAISYRVPFRGTGQLDIQVWLDKLGDTSAVYAFRMLSTDGATVHAEGRRVHIRLDPATLRPTAWTPACRAVCEEFLLK